MKKLNKYGWYFISGALILWVVFMLYPFFYSLYLISQVGAGDNLTFGGFQNAIRLCRDSILWTAVKNVFIVFIVQIPIMTIVAIIFSVVLNNPRLRFKNFYRFCLFVPVVMGAVSYSMIFKAMLTQDGIVNKILLHYHIINEPIMWLYTKPYAMIIIIIALLWRWIGYTMIYFLAGLQNISSDIYEAARIDGAGFWKILFKITIPLLKPIILFNFVTSTIRTLQLFDLPQVLTEGGPSNSTLTISQYIYQLSFEGIPAYGYATTLAYLIVILAVILAIIQFKLIGGKDE